MKHKQVIIIPNTVDAVEQVFRALKSKGYKTNLWQYFKVHFLTAYNSESGRLIVTVKGKSVSFKHSAFECKTEGFADYAKAFEYIEIIGIAVGTVTKRTVTSIQQVIEHITESVWDIDNIEYRLIIEE